jgi:opacity protein-like surface antigen
MNRHKLLRYLPTFALVALFVTGIASADENRYYLEAHLGQSLNGADSLEADATDLPPGRASVDYETGFASGLALGRRLGPDWRVEVEYLYRTDELGFAEFTDGTRFDEGDFSSVTLSANAYYEFPDLLKQSDRELRIYLGAGVGWIQEVDIDFESEAGEISYETDEIAYQMMAGLRWGFAERWALDFEYRLLKASDVKMTSRTGSVTSDYEPVTLGFALSYSF